MPPTVSKLKFYIVSHYSERSSALHCLHYTLAVSPENETAASREKSMWYQILYDSRGGQRYYQQTAIAPFTANDAIAQVLVGTVESARQRALEQLIADPRYFSRSISSRDWVKDVLTVLISSQIVKSDSVLVPEAAIDLLDRLTTETAIGTRPIPRGDPPPTLVYSKP